MRAFPTVTTHSLVTARPALLVFLTLAIALLLWLLIQGPILMNDGPVHLNFTRVLFFPGSLGPLQSAVFRPAMKIEQNLLLYFILAALIPLVEPLAAEALVQWLCFVGPVAAAMWTCATIRRDNLWVGLLAAPMAINQMLFLGLYSFTLSCIAFLILMGLAVRCVRRPGPGLAAALLAMLVLAFLSHAAGFLMALCAAGLLFAHAALFGWRASGTPPWRLLWPIGALAVAGCMELAMLLTHRGDPTRYGEIGLLYRISHLPTLHLLWINGLQHVFPLAFSATLLGCAALALMRRLHDRDGDNRMLWGLIAAAMGLVVLQLIVPDTAGGGWGHARRFEVGPWMGFVMCLAALPMSRRMIWTCGGATAVLLGAQAQAMLSLQDEVGVQQRAFLAADHLIGAHCTVAPVVLEPGLIPNDLEIRVPGFHPFLQAANRFELHDDRVVLYNFLARLRPYPVHFRPGAEPQQGLFGWDAAREEPPIKMVDIAGYEARSGLKVDYVLVRNVPEKLGWSERLAFASVPQGRYRPIYRAPEGALSLFQRVPLSAGCRSRTG